MKAFNKSAYAVIGAGYGDEGKGLTVDVMARRLRKEFNLGETPMVARGNGGSQAGHTVVTPCGKRHVYNQISSGTFAGSATYFGENMMVDLVSLEKEHKALQGKGLDAGLPYVYANPNTSIITIFDILLNQAIESFRGEGRHGSCGCGVFETFNRNNNGLRITLAMVLNDTNAVYDKLSYIKNNWVLLRLKESGISRDHPVTDLLWDYMRECSVAQLTQQYSNIIKGTIFYNTHPSALYANVLPLIVEGAQGLLIDKDMGDFPHVTPSNTGLISAMKVASEVGKTEITPIYVTRAYSTRHGAGPLPLEGEPITNSALVDKTNGCNAFQGALRYAPLDVVQLSASIDKDMRIAHGCSRFFNMKINPPKIVVTCMDQMGDFVNISKKSDVLTLKTEDVPWFISDNTEIELFGVSYGETHETFKFLRKAHQGNNHG